MTKINEESDNARW